MGLDCYWMKKAVNENGEEIKIDASIDEEIRVCSGLFSGNGNSSFRGKVYAGIVEKASKISLFKEWIENSDVIKIADSLEALDLSSVNSLYNCPYGDEFTEEEFSELKKMFRLHADAGHCLHGWW